MKKTAINKRILKENLTLGSMTIPALVIGFLFAYLPMFGIILTFKNYKVSKGIWGSDWADPIYKNFEFFVKSNDASRVIRNTLCLNFLFIFEGLIVGVAFALLLFEVKKAIHVKVYQTFAILPNFLSWVAVSYIVYVLLDYDKGIINQIIRFFGGNDISWYTEPGYWPVILTLVQNWHGVGMGCIVYYASLMGIDSELFEAAEVDGASKMQRILHISIPHLVPIMIMLTILNIGNIFRADFGLFYNVTRNVGRLYPVTDVMDTYIYRTLMSVGDVGMSSAGSFIQSIVCTITIVATNAIVKKIQPEYTLF